MRIFGVVLAVVWAVVVYITVVAWSSQGLQASSDVFAADLLAGNWRSQYNADLLAHMMLMGVWVAWRQKFSLKGLVLAVPCALGGSLASFVYLIVLLVHHKGDVVKVLLGARAATSPA